MSDWPCPTHCALASDAPSHTLRTELPCCIIPCRGTTADAAMKKLAMGSQAAAKRSGLLDGCPPTHRVVGVKCHDLSMPAHNAVAGRCCM